MKKGNPKPEPRHQNDDFRHQKQQLMQRNAVFGSCTQAVGTVASVFYAVINRTGHYDETAQDSEVTRQAKILYVSLLESVQKERGEWQGFSSLSSDANNNNESENTRALSPQDLLTSSISTSSTQDQLGILNELLKVSFRNLMGPMIPLEFCMQHKVLLHESLDIPPTLTTLLAIREVLNLLEREVRHCLLRLLSLWGLIALVSGESQPLMKTIADKHHHVVREASDRESMTTRKSGRHDNVAIDLLRIMVLYRDILFSDIEFILTRQELQISLRLVEDVRDKGWPSDLEPAAMSEEEDDRFSNDGDISSSSDENQILHDDAAKGLLWGQAAALEPLALRPRALSSVPSMAEEKEQQDGEDEEIEWSIPTPPPHSYCHRQDQMTPRSRGIASPPVSGGAGPLVPVHMIPTRSEEIPPPTSADFQRPRLMERTSFRRRHSQRSLSSTLDSPTHSVTSPTDSSTRSTSRMLKQCRSSSSLGNRSSDRQRNERYRQESINSKLRPPTSRSTTQRSERLRRKRSSSTRCRTAADQTVQDDVHRYSKHKHQDKQTGKPSYFSLASSYLTIPVTAATLCILATMATFAICELRKSQRN